MNQAKVEIYTKDYCPYCTKAKQLLHRKEVAFVEHDISNDVDKQIALVEMSGGRRTVPQIFINGQHVGGCDELHALEAAGKLNEMLKLAV